MSINEQYNNNPVSRRDFMLGSLGFAAGLGFASGTSRADALEPTLKLAQPIRSVQVNQKLIALTFDDGPWPKNTEKVMDHFDDFGLQGRATFFQIGDNIKQYRAISTQVAARGYEIGNHSMTHTYNPSTIAREIKPTRKLISGLGVESNLFRSPGLTEGYEIQRKLGLLGMVNVFTDYDIGDWRAPRITSKAIASRTRKSLHPGSIVLLHDGGDHENTVDAVPYILESALNKGYEIVSLGELLSAEKH